MRIDDVIKKMREGKKYEESELQAVLDYIAFLEFGYSSLERPDMVPVAKQSASSRLDDWRRAGPSLLEKPTGKRKAKKKIGPSPSEPAPAVGIYSLGTK